MMMMMAKISLAIFAIFQWVAVADVSSAVAAGGEECTISGACSEEGVEAAEASVAASSRMELLQVGGPAHRVGSANRQPQAAEGAEGNAASAADVAGDAA